MSPPFYVIFIVLSVIIVSSNSQFFDALKPKPKTVRIYKFAGSCPGYDLPIFFENIHVGLVNRVNTISMKVVVKKDVDSEIKLSLELKRCQSREALDSCEKYQTVTVNKLCGLVNVKNSPWEPATKLAKPPLGCPIKKGAYVITNGTFDGSAFAHLPIAGWYWIVTAKVYTDKTNELLLCMSMEGQIVPV